MEKEKIVMVNSLSPGDILMMTCAIRALHKAHPDRFLVDVRSPCNEVFMNSPYITPMHPANHSKENQIIEELKRDADHPPIELEGIKYLISHYPEIHRSSMTGSHFSDGHRLFLAKQLKISIPASGIAPDIFFSNSELAMISPLKKFFSLLDSPRYWVINAGIKNDYTLKWYNHYQEVIELLRGKIQFVQIGNMAHDHPALNGVMDMRGKTNLRELFRLIKDADGVVSCVSMPMVVAAALKKPCVVVSGAREGVRWQINPDHQFLYRNGCMSCAEYDGCWKSRLEDCINKHPENGQPMCMELIAPEEIVRAIQLYYLGGRLAPISENIIKTSILPPKVENFEKNPQKTPVILEKNDILPRQEPFFDIDGKHQKRMINAHIFNILRILKKNFPQDQYLEAYQWHYAKRGENFMDSYHIMHWIGSHYAPKRVLEIGCRTGVSICQLLSSYFDHSDVTVDLCDVFAEMGSPEIVQKNIDSLNIPIMPAFHFGSSLGIMPRMIEEGRTFDYILVDGCHDKDYARQDLINAVKLIEPRGFILFDDITPDGCSLQDVWDEFKKNYSGEFSFLEDHNGKGIGVATKKLIGDRVHA